MKKCLFFFIAILSVYNSNGMMRSMMHHMKPLHLQRMTPVLARRLHGAVTQPDFTKNRWPAYTGEQADLIKNETLRTSHLNFTDADNINLLKRSIEVTSAYFCPDHKLSFGTRKECATCCLPQTKAFYLIRAELYKRH